jgi:uncharacterized alkaline shock family protein YloU
MVIPKKDKNMTHTENVPGKIHISHQALASIASESALSSYGVVGLAAKNFAENLSRVLIKDPNLGVDISFSKNEIVLDLFIVVEYGTRIKSVASSVAENVKYNVEHTTGLVVKAVNIHVRGLRISNTD